jgi:hypothetical protein
MEQHSGAGQHGEMRESHNRNMNGSSYFEHLTDRDFLLLAAISGRHQVDEEWLRSLRDDPDRFEALLGSAEIFAALFPTAGDEALLSASPFLAFAVLLHRVQADLRQVHFVEEWVGPRRRMPLFDVGGLRRFVAEPARRLFLAELLASYTRVFSGSTWVRTQRGWRRRRFSELDPLRLLELAEMVPEGERAAVYRRLGDLALFLTGVFPDYAASGLLSPIQHQRLERRLKLPDDGGSFISPGQMPGNLPLLERLGRRSYELAWRGTAAGAPPVLAEMAEGFGEARRLLNVLTDRYLFPHRQQWFPLPES